MDEEKPFTVRDRRKFTAEGERREHEGQPAENESPHTPAPDAPAARPEVAPAPPRAGAGPAETGVDFAGFLVSLASQAGMLLSTPEGDSRENLQGAQHLIEVIEMLEQKTRGNLTGEEEQVLRQLLYELRMAFVERSRTEGA